MPPSGPSAPAPRISPTWALVVAVAAISWAGPLVRYATAPALVVAAWRLLFSIAFVATVLAFSRGGRDRWPLRGREWALAVLAGILLSGHFWAWIASIRYTSVASSVVLVSTQPFFAAALSVAFLGERPTRRQWGGISIAVVGAAVIGWGDFGAGSAALFGDFLALSAAFLAASYYVIGRRLRMKLDLWPYVGLVYGVSAVVLLGAVLALPSLPLTGYPLRDWLVFLALAAGPMLLGHTGVNYALRYLPAYVANLALLGEPIGATLLAWVLPGIREAPSLQVVAGGALILLGIWWAREKVAGENATGGELSEDGAGKGAGTGAAP